MVGSNILPGDYNNNMAIIFYFRSGNNCISCREYAVDRTKFFAGTLCIFFHSTLTDDNAYSGFPYKFIFKFFKVIKYCKIFKKLLTN